MALRGRCCYYAHYADEELRHREIRNWFRAIQLVRGRAKMTDLGSLVPASGPQSHPSCGCRLFPGL